jgi:hypothetical protein
MIDIVNPPSATSSGRPGRRRWIALVAVLVVVIGAVTTTVAVSWHYLHAPGLATDGGGWLPPDSQHSRSVDAGPYHALVIPPRPGHAQTFAIDVHNPSSVTQTLLGLAYDNTDTAEPERVTVSTTSTAMGDARLAQYTSRPVAIPPNGVRTVRLTQFTAGTWTCRSESWTELRLRVRVGAFTRTETIDFSPLIFEIRDPSKTCQ